MIELKKLQKAPVTTYYNEVPVNPLVSIVVQTYQHSKYIAECLEGVLKQKTNFPIEILVGEDESIDGTREICIEYAKKYPNRIRLFLHSRENVIFIKEKPTGRFNFLWNLKHAKGKYIALCEGDDYWTDPYKLQKQIDFLEKNKDYSLCYTDYSIVDKKGNLLKSRGVPDKFKKPKLDHLTILEYYTPQTLTTVFRKNALPSKMPNDFSKVKNGDVFLFSLLTQSKHAAFLDINSGCYRQNHQGVWSMKSVYSQKNMTIQTFMEMKKNFPTKNEQKAINARMSRTKIILALSYFKDLKIVKAIKLISQSFKLSTKPYKDFIRKIVKK